MEILNKDIKSFTFESVVKFCEEKYKEGIQVDYKAEYPKKGLAKHITAFSNTRGGVIIVGVEEDMQTGLPVAWEGVVADAKLVDRLNQEIANVEPLPSCIVHATNIVNGKFFILVRVFEGSSTPYYVQNNSNVYVRTGNITTPIEIASPDGLELLFGKKEKAEKTRHIYKEIAEDVHVSAFTREANKEKGEKVDHSQRSYLDSTLCQIIIQPYFPLKALSSPAEIKKRVNEFTFNKFPKSSYEMEPIPEGILYYNERHDGFVECQQIYSKGVIFGVMSITLTKEDGVKLLLISHIAILLYTVLKVAKSFYETFDYQGVLCGNMELSGKTNELVTPISDPGYYDDEPKSVLLDTYNWDLSLDTTILSNEEEFEKFYMQKVKDIYWHFGYDHVNEELITSFLSRAGLKKSS